MWRQFKYSFLIILIGVSGLPSDATAVVFDPAFGAGGATIIRIPDSGDHGGVVHRLADGRIIAAGGSSPIGGNNLGLMTVFNSNGGLDGTFASGGVVQSSTIDGFYALTSDSSGRILVAGTGGVDTKEFAIRRLNPDGSLHTNFTTVNFAEFHDYPQALVVGNDGSVVAAGYATHGGAPDAADIAVAHFSSFGQVNWSRTEDFAPAGFASTIDVAFAAAIQPDGKVLVGGGGGGVNGNDWVGGFHLLRYNGDGSRDASFGDNGFVHTPFVNPFESTYLAIVHDLRVLSDGKILASGRSSRGALMFVKYNSDGTLANDFGNGGVALAAADPQNIQFDNISTVEHRQDGSTRVLWLSDSLLYEAIVSSAGEQLSLKTYPLPHLPLPNYNFQEYSQALVLPDGDILAVGRAAAERYMGQTDWIYGTELLIARFEGNLDQVPEPSSLLLLIGALGLMRRVRFGGR